MNLTAMLRVIGRHKVLLILGILLAIAAGFATMFRVETGTLTPRAEPQYRASTQLLVTDPTSVFSTKTPPQVVVEGETQPTPRDLTSLTVVYAYLVSSNQVLDLVESEIGELGDHETLTSAQRTTQPTATTNTGTYRLPILDIVGESSDPDRAALIASTAADVFRDLAAQQQDDAGLDPTTRVQFEVIRELGPDPVDGTNPLLPVIAVGIGVFLAFLALIFAVDNVRMSRGRETLPTVGPPPAHAGGRTQGAPTGSPVMARTADRGQTFTPYPPQASRHTEPAARP